MFSVSGLQCELMHLMLKCVLIPFFSCLIIQFSLVVTTFQLSFNFSCSVQVVYAKSCFYSYIKHGIYTLYVSGILKGEQCIAVEIKVTFADFKLISCIETTLYIFVVLILFVFYEVAQMWISSGFKIYF